MQIDLSGQTALVTDSSQGPQALIRRRIEPEEIANAVSHHASPRASATTGGALRVHGGSVDGILP